MYLLSLRGAAGHRTVRSAAVVVAMSIGTLAACSPDAAYDAAEGQLKRDLHEYVIIQEMHYTMNRRYAAEVDSLHAIPGNVFEPGPGVTIEILTSSVTGHSAKATASAFPDLQCAVRVGSADQPLGGQSGDGEAICTRSSNAP